MRDRGGVEVTSIPPDSALSPLAYLASPYSSADDGLRLDRFRAACNAVALLAARGVYCVSPIAQNHPVAELNALAGDWTFWEPMCTTMLRGCGRMIVLTIPGWADSVGVRAEYRFAVARGLPVDEVVIAGGVIQDLRRLVAPADWAVC